MATSGTQNFKLDVADVIEDAYERIGMEARTAYDARKARRSMNIMFQDWMNRGINLWTVNQVVTPLTAGQETYVGEDFDVDVLEAVVRKDGTDYEMERIMREDYLYIPNKTSQSRPTQIYVERSIPLKVILWPVPQDNSYTLVTYRIQRIEDVKSSQNDVDVPARFIPAMVSGLAYYLSVKMKPEMAQLLEGYYEKDFARAANEDSERGSLYIRPARR